MLPDHLVDFFLAGIVVPCALVAARARVASVCAWSPSREARDCGVIPIVLVSSRRAPWCLPRILELTVAPPAIVDCASDHRSAISGENSGEVRKP